ncbi:helix-turn-helix transcriptional regulator [Pseudonocardia phyllosphaerae]|uniref:helix-turn-helix transcriptional regulator n=1 Tax=Pseudonocardia phyllosphaerae TaxID=3390502 RepID=UPI00397CA234
MDLDERAVGEDDGEPVGLVDDPFPPSPVTPVPDASDLVRTVRRRADLSQRELAREVGVSPTTIARIESRTLAPSLVTLGKVLAVAGLRLAVVDTENRQVPLMSDPPGDDLRDGAGRRYPSHLDTILDPLEGEWWGDRYGLARPPETFHRDRALRDALRRRSVWEVRVAQLWSAPPPPTLERWIQLTARCEHCHRLPEPIPLPYTAERVVRYLSAAARVASDRLAVHHEQLRRHPRATGSGRRAPFRPAHGTGSGPGRPAVAGPTPGPAAEAEDDR